jgi:hypothetical protein
MRLASVMKPWKEAGVTPSEWRKAQRAVVGLIAELVWRARGSSDRRHERDAAMQRLTRIAEGDPVSTRYGLDLAQREAEHSALVEGEHKRR